MNTTRTVNCPECGQPRPWSKDNPYRPFCSERCKLIDLGAWASESYRINGPEPVPDSSHDLPTDE